jgi:hypothetical protein
MKILTQEVMFAQLGAALPPILAKVRQRRQLLGGGWLHLTAYFDSNGNLYQKREDIEPQRQPSHFQIFGAGPVVRVSSRYLRAAGAKRRFLHTENQTVEDAAFFAWVSQSKERVIDVTVRLLTDLSAEEGEGGDLFADAPNRNTLGSGFRLNG